MKIKNPVIRTAIALCALCFVQLTTISALAQATVTTDKEDYPPFSYVYMTGTSYAPNEVVQIQLEMLNADGSWSLVESNADWPNPWSLTADANGSFTDEWYLWTEDFLGVTFQLTATGLTSGLIAQDQFRDAVNGSLTVTPTSVDPGTINTFSMAFKSNGGDASASSVDNPRSVAFTLPASFTSLANISVTDDDPATTFSFSQSGNTITATVTASGQLHKGFTVTLQLDATAPNTSGDTTWTALATGSTSGNTVSKTDTVTVTTTRTWNGSANDGNWNNAANWTGGVPASGDTANIPGGLATTYPTINNSVTIATVNINSAGSGATVTVAAGGTFNVSAPLNVNANGTLTQSGGTILSAFTLTASGIVNQTGGTLHMASTLATTPTADITINAGGSMTSSSSVDVRALTVNGTFTQSGGTILCSGNLALSTTANASTFNQTGGTLHMASALATVPTAQITINAGGTFNQAGNVDVKAFTIDSAAGALAAGAWNQTAGTFRSYNDFKNSGTFIASAGQVQFSANGGANSFNSPGLNQFFDVLVDTGITKEFDTHASTIKVRGNWDNNGTASLTATATTVEFNGTGAQTIGGTSSTTFNNLVANKSGGSLTLTASETVAATLTFTSGNITTGPNILTVGTSATTGTVSPTGGYVIGNLKKFVRNETVTRVFEVGTASFYTPLTLSRVVAGTAFLTGANTATSFFTVSSTTGEHASISTSGINQFTDVNNYWSITSGGAGSVVTTGYKVKGEFVNPAGIDTGANTSAFIVRRFISPSWQTLPNGASPLTRTSTSTEATVTFAAAPTLASGTGVGDFAIGEVDAFDVGAVTDSNAAANSVAENAANGTVVGVTASASDADGSAISYSLDNDAGGRFGINGVSGVVTVANGTLLNYELATSHSITVRATSTDSSFSTANFTINVTDVDEFDVGTVTDSNAAANSVAENAANGTAVGVTASASDADGSNNTITYSLDANAGGRFGINGVSGVVTVANGTLLNYEAATSHSIAVRATSSDGSFNTANFTINLTDVDEFDVGAVTDNNAAANSVAENAANGTVVGITASASDADGSNNTITYSLDDDAGGRFGINGVSGVVTVANGSLLNYEAATSHSITVRATSVDASFNTANFTINLTDEDESDVGAVTDSNAAANSVAENAANGTAVGVTASASDADASNNTITYSLDDDAGGRFGINGVSGVVTVANGSLLNYEANTSHSITVKATSSDSSFSSETFTIAVTDVDEFDVVSVTDSDGASGGSVAENAANGTAVGITGAASDGDGSNNTITYSLTDNAGGRFGIDGVSGVVSVANGSLLNYEANTSHSITVKATSSDSSFSSETFTIAVTDVDEFDVVSVTDSDGASGGSVAENAANGTAVGITGAASDGDGSNNTITYSLTDNAGGRFAIDGVSGVVTVADGSLLNYELNTSHSITVKATSSDTSSSTETFTIAVTDVDEFDVVSVSDSDGASGGSVAENAANGTAVGITGAASDADGSNNTITYSLTDNAGGRFAIDGVSGVVTVADGSLLNYELNTSHSITVKATSSDTSSSTETFTIAVTDVDEFDVVSVSDSDGASGGSVAENAANGTAVGITGAATDADGSNNTITYSLTDNAGGRFAIDGVSGVVTVADGSLLNYELNTSHSITVKATSSDTSSSTETFTIAVTDVDEFDVVSVSDSDGASGGSVAENAANGTAVGITGAASDADGSNNTITYSLTDNAGGRFAIDGVSGVVTVADGSLLNYELNTSHSITVKATSSDTSSSTETFTIAVTDVDEFDVVSVSDSDGASGGSVAENAANGTAVGITGAASDADGSNNTITYSLTDNAGGRFAIDGVSGVVTVADGSLLNYEAATSHSITVKATSSDTSSSTETFTIAVTDVDEFDVVSVTDSDGASGGSVAENAANGTAVGITGAASDADGSNNTITYSLTDNAGGRFAIDGVSGVVTVADGSLLNYELNTSHSITVKATSSDTSSSTETFTIAVTDVDEFDVVSVSDSDGASGGSVAENAANGTAVGITGAATDADGSNNTITYSLTDNAGGRFAIDGVSGVVTVADGSLLNYELNTSHSITVKATSSDTSSSTETFTIAVTDVDEFDVVSVSDSDGASGGSVAENAANGTAVGITGAATDADGSNNTITYSLTANAGGRFAIDGVSGVVTVADGSLLNYELNTSHSITVKATSGDTSSSTETFTIAVTDVDEFDVVSVSDSDGASGGSVAENAANGTAVGITGAASDADGSNNTITYSLDDNAGGRFAIDGSSGVVTVANGTLLNYEAATSHTITVKATSADTSSSTANFTINLTDVDEFDVGAMTDNNAAANSVAENAANGTVVGITALASDGDGSNNTITYSLDDNAGGRFAIDGSSGVVTVANGTLLNYEAAISHSITVKATSADSSFNTANFTINLTDVDEFDVGAVTDSNAAANSVAEDAANGTVVGITALASDGDGSNNTITYSLDNSAGGRFAINGVSGVVTVANGSLLNYELNTSHTITVKATSSDGSSSTANFTINVTDVDEFDVGAVTDSSAAANSVAENAANGTAVGVIGFASDVDGSNNTITYSLDDSAGGRFAIDGVSGVVTVANGSLLNYEAATSHSITVRATSADSSFSTANFTINVTDVDEYDVGAVTDSNAAANSVAENAANGTAVGVTASASDADGSNNTITYSLDNNAGGRFGINGVSGVVTVANGTLLNYEAATSHSITVRATSADSSFSTESFTINVADVDEFNVGTVTDSNAAANSVAENAANGTAVGVTASASDADGSNNTITYSLDNNAGGRFAIDGSSGVVTVANGTLLNYEGATSHSITVRATSADSSFSTASFTINVTDVDEYDVGAVTDSNAAANSVAENAANGTAVGVTASASDADGSNNTITYSLDNNAGGRFGINGVSGVVTVANGTLLNYEAATSHSITVKATSSDGSSSTANFTINLTDVNEAPVASITPDALTVLYGETIGSPGLPITIDASDVDNGACGTLSATAECRYKPNAGSFGTWQAGLPSDLVLSSPTVSGHSASWTISGAANSTIGTYEIRVTVADGCGSSKIVTTTLIVQPSCVTPLTDVLYVGQTYLVTDANGFTKIALSAGLKACSGDIRTAIVSFATRNGDGSYTPISGASNLKVGLVDPGNTGVGTATAIVNWNLGNSDLSQDIQIAVIVGGNYSRNNPNDDEVVTIARPVATSSMLGCGKFNNGNPTESRGYLKGADGDKTQVFFNLTYGKGGSNPKGRVTILVHSYNKPDGTTDTVKHCYLIKSTAIASLALTQAGTTTLPAKASFSSKCVITDITNPNSVVSVDGGATLQITATDGQPKLTVGNGTGDFTSIYVLNKNGGVWYADKLDASLRAVELPIVVCNPACGDIAIH